MLHRLSRRVTPRAAAWAGVFGLGLMPCPDCGLPLAIKLWPVAGIFWLWNRFRRRNAARLDLLLSEDLAARAGSGDPASPERPTRRAITDRHAR